MNIKRIFIIFSIIAVFSNSFAEIKNLEEREFYFDVKDKDLQIVNLAANKANLSEILEIIYQKTGISIKIERDRKNELITLNLIELPLSTVLKKMIRENYVMIFQKTEKGFMLSDGKALKNSNRENSFDEVNDFTGMIVIDGTVAKMFYSTADESPEGLAAYIYERHQLLDRLVKTDPDKTIEAQISFNNFLTGDELLKFIDKYNISIKNLNSGWGEHVGNLEINDKQTPKEAIKLITNYEEKAIDNIYKSTKDFLESEGKEDFSIEEIESAKSLMRETEDRKQSLKEKGVMFYGIVVNGKAVNIKGVKDKSKEVKLADPLWGGEIESLMKKSYEINQIPIPILPK